MVKRLSLMAVTPWRHSLDGRQPIKRAESREFAIGIGVGSVVTRRAYRASVISSMDTFANATVALWLGWNVAFAQS